MAAEVNNSAPLNRLRHRSFQITIEQRIPISPHQHPHGRNHNLASGTPKYA